MEIESAKVALAEVGAELYARGWVPATSGNFSLRLADGNLAITASGRHKGRLEPRDILVTDPAGRVLATDGQRPSAETALHVQLYQRDPAIRAVLHTHSLGATLASRRGAAGLRFAGLELLKAFDGVDTHETTVSIPVFPNTQDMTALSARVEQHMGQHGTGVAYLIDGHGLYTWGRDMASCLRHLEALEYLFEYERLAGAAEHR